MDVGAACTTAIRAPPGSASGADTTRALALPAALLEKLKKGVLSLLVNTQGARTMREKSDELVERAAAKDNWTTTVSVSRARADG